MGVEGNKAGAAGAAGAGPQFLSGPGAQVPRLNADRLTARPPVSPIRLPRLDDGVHQLVRPEPDRVRSRETGGILRLATGG